MKPELTEQIVTKALDYLKSAEAFAKTEVPAYLQEIITYHIYSGALSALMNFIIACASIYCLVRVAKDDESKTVFGIENAGVGFLIGGLVGSVMGTVLFSHNVLDVLKATFAPRMFLLEYFSSLIK